GSATRSTYAFLILLTYVFVEISAVLYLGALALHALLDIPVFTSILALAALTGIYTVLGSLRAVIWTEMMQLGILVVGGAILTIATLKAAGGIETLLSTTKDWHLFLPADDPDFPWTMYLGGVLCISTFYCATNQFIVQRVLAAKNEWHARMGVIFGDYLKFLVPLIITLPALVAFKIVPDLDTPDLLFPTLVKMLLPPGLIGLVMAGLIAAVMSHLSGAINSCTTILTVDVYLAFFKKDASEQQAVRFGRIAGTVIILLGIACTLLLMSYSDKPIFIYLMNAYGLFTPGIATMFLLGILWKKTTSAGALTAGLVTLPLSLLLEFAFPNMPFFNRTGIVFWICMALCAAISWVTKPQPEEALKGLIWNRESLTLQPHEKEMQKGWRNPAIWWAIITAAVLFFYFKFP